MHIAIVTFGYLPLKHVSVKRPSFFASELARRGHTVTVVTMDWRTPMPVTVADVARAVTDSVCDDDIRVVRLDARRRLPSFDPEAIPRVTEPPIHSAVRRRAVTLWRLLGWGPFASWARDAATTLHLIHGTSPIDVVWAIHGDPSAHEAARSFAVAARVPWVADFKDPWDLYYEGAARHVAYLASRLRLRSASCLTETSAGQAAKDERTFRKDAHVIWSGYNRVAMAAASVQRDAGAAVLAYLGTVNSQHDVDLLVRGWQRLRAEHPVDETKLRLIVYSSSAGALTRPLEAAGFGDRTTLRDPVDEHAAFSVMQSATALLLFPNRDRLIGVKELEYVASGTPILALGQLHEEMSAVVRGTSQVVEATTAEATADALLRIIRGIAPPHRAPVNGDAVAVHDWQHQAILLERVLVRAAQGYAAPR